MRRSHDLFKLIIITAFLAVGDIPSFESTAETKQSKAPPAREAPKAGAASQRGEKKGVKKAAKSKISVSNDACYVCHLDFQGEEIVETHLGEDMGCGDCHGPSEGHIADEQHLTPPDVIITRSKINAFCEECHADRERCTFTSGEAKERKSKGLRIKRPKVCTDCHGEHKLDK